MTDHVTNLNQALARSGEDVVLRRVVGGGVSAIYNDVKCRAFVRDYAPHEMTGSVSQGDTRVILSPTEIMLAQWPGGEPLESPPSLTDHRVPRKDDQAIVAGRTRTVIAAAPIYAAGELVRIELQVRGG